MEAVSTKTERIRETAERYDGDIDRYASHLNQMLEGVYPSPGELPIPGNGGSIRCVSIDSIAGFPDDYSIDIVPKKPNGRYYLDFIVYAPGEEKTEFTRNGKGPERVKVEFERGDIRKAIYNFFNHRILNGKKAEDITLEPLVFKKERWPDYGARAERVEARRKKLKKRYEKNEDRLWFYYTTNLNGKPAFVAHIPQDPYEAVPLLKSWINSLVYLGGKLSKK